MYRAQLVQFRLFERKLAGRQTKEFRKTALFNPNKQGNNPDRIDEAVIRLRVKMGRWKISDSAKKRRKSGENRLRKCSRICLGQNCDRWSKLRQDLGFTNVQLAEHLLDVHDKFCSCTRITLGDKMEVKDNETEPIIPTCLPVTPRLAFSTPLASPLSRSYFSPAMNSSNASMIVQESTLTPTRHLESTPIQTSEPLQARVSPTSISNDISRCADLPVHAGHDSTDDEDEAAYDPNLSDTRATVGEDIEDISDVEEDLLTMPLPKTDCDAEVNMPDSTEPLMNLIHAPKFIGFVDPLLDFMKLAVGHICTRPNCNGTLMFSNKLYGTALVIRTDGTV